MTFSEWVPVIVSVVAAIATIIAAVISARAAAKAEIRKVDGLQLEAVAELEKELALTKKALAEEKEARERLGADLVALRKWKDDYLADEGRRRDAAKSLAQKDRAGTDAKVADIITKLEVLKGKVDSVLDLAGGLHGLGRALHGRTSDAG